MSLYDRIYSKLPLFLQNTAITTYGLYWRWLRFGGGYQEHEDGYKTRDFFDHDSWSKYQKEKLRNLITIAAREVPYYRDQWNTNQIHKALNGNISALPLLEKDPIRENPGSFIRQDKLKTRYWTSYTSGSTGTPIATYWTAEEIRDSLAVREVRSANWAGVSFKLPRATFSGRMVEPKPDSKGPFYRFNAVEKQVYFSPFHLRPDTAQFYIEALKKHKIQWMTGYAVSYYLLAKFILDKGLEVPPIKAIITTSEKLTPEMRQVMQEAFHCRIFEEYSTVENALFASECEHGRLHVSPDVGIVEILRPDGSPCEMGEIGEVVTTCLMRLLQPMIRYRLGDLASWENELCPCGRSMPVIKEVVGRVEDVVIGPDGRQMVRFHGIFADQPHIVEGQIIQESVTRIIVKIVPTSNYSQEDTDEVIRRVQQRLGLNVSVNVEKVNEIPRLSSGKFQAVISKVRS